MTNPKAIKTSSKKAAAKKPVPQAPVVAKKTTAKKVAATQLKQQVLSERMQIALALINRADGATTPEIMKAAKWSGKAVANAIWHMRHTHGIKIDTFRNNEKQSAYRKG